MLYPATQLACMAGKLSGSAPSFLRLGDRAALTPAAITAVRRLADAWRLSRSEAAALAGTTESGWTRICCGAWAKPLTQDQLTRITAVIGLLDVLIALFPDDPADGWLRLPNNGSVFNNRTPLQTMLEDGIPGMIEVRRYLDGLRGGI